MMPEAPMARPSASIATASSPRPLRPSRFGEALATAMAQADPAAFER